MTEELRLLSGQLTAYQKQAQIFLERILDIDQVGREVQQNTRAAYFFDQPHDTALFRFERLSSSALVQSETAAVGKSYIPIRFVT